LFEKLVSGSTLFSQHFRETTSFLTRPLHSFFLDTGIWTIDEPDGKQHPSTGDTLNTYVFENFESSRES